MSWFAPWSPTTSFLLLSCPSGEFDHWFYCRPGESEVSSYLCSTCSTRLLSVPLDCFICLPISEMFLLGWIFSSLLLWFMASHRVVIFFRLHNYSLSRLFVGHFCISVPCLCLFGFFLIPFLKEDPEVYSPSSRPAPGLFLFLSRLFS